MTDPTTTPDDEPTAVPAAEPPAPVTPQATPWYSRRFPLFAVVVVLLAGCFLGAGVTAFGAIVVSHVHREHVKVERPGEPRVHRMQPWGGRGEGPHGFGDRRGPGGGNGAKLPAPPAASPSPTGS
jgi:hypothetical protein